MASETESEGSGDEIRPHGDPHDSSEDEEDDPEELRKLQEGFIAEDDDDAEEDEDLEPEERRRRRKDKRKKRKRSEAAISDEELDEDDLELLAENTGQPGRNKAKAQSQTLKRIRRRGYGSEEDDDEEEPSRRNDRGRGRGDQDEDDLDIFADEPVSTRRGGEGDELDDSDMDDFIEEDDEEENEQMTEAERRTAALAKRAQRKAAAKKHRNFAGAGLETRQELEDVFGDGGEYANALSADARGERGRSGKARIEDIFEPTEISDKFLTKEDQIVRETDIPERYQFSSSTLSLNPVRRDLSEEFPISPEAAIWCASRIGHRVTAEFTDGAQEYTEPFLTAIEQTLDAIFNQHYEIPYIWHYRRDSLRQLSDDGTRKIYLHRDELWTLYDLGLKYKAVFQRRDHVDKLYERMKELDPTFSDHYFEDHVLALPKGTAIQSVEAANEALAWLELKYADLTERAKEQSSNVADRKRAGGGSKKFTRRGRVAEMLPLYGLDPSRVVEKFITGDMAPESTNSDFKPHELAERFTEAMEGMPEAEDVLKVARNILVQEFGRDPVLLQKLKDEFKDRALLNCVATEKGKAKIDEFHRYYRYKYLRGLPVAALSFNAWYTQMQAAEADGLLILEIFLHEDSVEEFEDRLGRCWESSDSEPLPEIWNKIRHEIVQEAIREILIPAAIVWLRDELKQRADDIVAERCQKELENRVNVRPYNTPSMQPGTSPSVISLSFGRGGKHAIMAICLDDTGKTTSHTKFNNLVDEDQKEAFWALLNDHNPDVVVLGGFSAETRRLWNDVDQALKEHAHQRMMGDREVDQASLFPRDHEHWPAQMQTKQIPLIYGIDDVARIYMNSQRAQQENPGWPANARYALGLARYVQDPLNEFCALGSDLTTITFVPDYQPLIGQERLLQVLERALVNVVNGVGLDINQAVRDSYLQKLLPYLSGLGPRKADAMIKAIGKSGGMLNNRDKLLRENILGPSIMVNVAAFLFIQQGELDEMDYRSAPKDDTDLPNPLDQTRIHPLDYELAAELCITLLHEDPEEAQERNASYFTAHWFNKEEETRTRIINESDIADYARRKLQQTGETKFYTVDLIAAELDDPFKDNRKEYMLPDEWAVCTMLTGETQETLSIGCIVTGHVIRSMQDQVIIRLESQVEGEVKKELIDAPEGQPPPNDARRLLTRGQAVRGVVTDVRPLDLYIAVSSRQQDVQTAGRARIEKILHPVLQYFDVLEEKKDMQILDTRKRREQGAVPRIVDHPAWHVANKTQAEKILSKQNRGDAVIRPSSQGNDHLAVTWKVDDGIYQHLDVTEINKPSAHELGKLFRVRDFAASYSDLDELLVEHVKAMADKVEALTHHEKYRKEDQIEDYLKQYVAAHAGKSAYGFCLDSSKPGWAKVVFLNKSLKDGGYLQSWPIRIMPGAYKLFEAEVPGVTELCTAFKTQYNTKLEEQRKNIGRTPAGGRSVYAPPSMHRSAVQRGGATPAARHSGAATPSAAKFGGATPGISRFGPTPSGFAPQISNLPGGMTPRPYMNVASPFVNAMAGARTPYGQPGMAPGMPMQPMPGMPGMNGMSGMPGMGPGMMRPPFPRTGVPFQQPPFPPNGVPYQQMNSYQGGPPPRPPVNSQNENMGWGN